MKKKETKETTSLDMNKLWKAEDAIAYLQIPKSTFHMHLAKGEIPKIKIGRHIRFLPEQLVAWAKRRAA